LDVVRITYLLRMAEITSGSSFESNNLTEQKLGYEEENLDPEDISSSMLPCLVTSGKVLAS